jgi:hypothetical protein
MIRPTSRLCAATGLLILAATAGALAQPAPSMPLPPSARTPQAPSDAATQRPEPQKRQAPPATRRVEPQKRPAEKKAPEPQRAQPQQPPPGAAAQPPAAETPALPPSQGLQGWFPMPERPRPAQQRVTLTSENVRPPKDMLLDCKDAPKTAVTKVPEPLARWATIYCTKNGHLFSYNDRHLARFPRTPALGAFSAAELTGRKGELGHAAHFTKVAYKPLSKEEAQALTAGADPKAANFLKDKQLFRIDLTADTGQTFSMIAADPEKDPFWVVTLVDGKLGRSFFVASLDYLNKRQ